MSSTAAFEGARWGPRAADWAELAAGISIPAWEAVADATDIGRGDRVLDVGCGSGEFCQRAAARGAVVSGIDAAEGMIEIARRLVPDADLCVGAMEALPWHDNAFEVVTSFNAFQFAADVGIALSEAKRVAREGGRVAICSWAPQDSDLYAVFAALRRLQPPRAATPAIDEPGVLEDLVRKGGLVPVSAAEVDVPFEAADHATLVRGRLAGGLLPAPEHFGEEAVRRTIVEAAAPFRRHDGSYRFENTFRYLIATA